eukprot:6040360-Amphidinium_carterae.1
MSTAATREVRVPSAPTRWDGANECSCYTQPANQPPKFLKRGDTPQPNSLVFAGSGSKMGQKWVIT